MWYIGIHLIWQHKYNHNNKKYKNIKNKIGHRKHIFVDYLDQFDMPPP